MDDRQVYADRAVLKMTVQRLRIYVLATAQLAEHLGYEREELLARKDLARIDTILRLTP